MHQVFQPLHNFTITITNMFNRSLLIAKTSIRHSSSSSAIKTLKRVPSVYNIKHSAGNIKPNYQPGLYHHPAPSVGIETPDVFLPSNDARKGFKSSKVNVATAPALSQPRENKLNLTPVEIAEIQKLRSEEPEKWTRKKLAEKFDVSPFTISLVSNPNAKRAEEMEGRLQTIKESWGRQRYLSRLDRKKRQVSWYRDE